MLSVKQGGIKYKSLWYDSTRDWTPGIFQTIQFKVSTQFKCQKQFDFKQLSFA